MTHDRGIFPYRSKITVYMALGVIYYAVWLLPRIRPVLNNVLLAEDFGNPVYIHLQTYRILLFADLSFWDFLVGPGYLATILPKFLAGLYLSLTGVFTVSLLRRWGVPMIVSSMVPLFYISHPVINELSLWNQMSGWDLSVLLIVAGYLLLEDALSMRRIVPAVLLIALGVSGYQIHAALLAILIAGEYLIKRISGVPYSYKEAARKAGIAIIIILVYAIYIKISQNIFGLYDFGHRGFISLRSLATADYMGDKIHGMSNMFANLFQPFISYYFGLKTSWFAWKWAPVCAGALTLILGLLTGRSAADMALFSIAPVILPGLATLVLLPMNATPSGWRVCGPILYAFCLSLVPAMVLAMKAVSRTSAGADPEKSAAGKTMAACIVLLLLMISFPVIAYDGDLRVQAKDKDERLLQDIRDYWKSKGVGPEGYSIAVYPQDRNGSLGTHTEQKGKGIVVSFNMIGPNDYTNLPRQFWDAVLKHYNYRPFYAGPGNKEFLPIMEQMCDDALAAKGEDRSELYVANIEKDRLSVICR